MEKDKRKEMTQMMSYFSRILPGTIFLVSFIFCNCASKATHEKDMTSQPSEEQSKMIEKKREPSSVNEDVRILKELVIDDKPNPKITEDDAKQLSSLLDEIELTHKRIANAETRCKKNEQKKDEGNDLDECKNLEILNEKLRELQKRITLIEDKYDE